MLKPRYQKFMSDIKDYTIISQIESGGFGSVYQVRNNKTGENLAAKMIVTHKNEMQYNQMINREIGILIRCQHPTIIKFIGYSLKDFNDQNNVTIFMELAPKGSLADLLKKVQNGMVNGIYDNTNRQIILIGVARGMMHLHNNRIIHRDLKPGNILLDDNLYPHITDFGLSKLYENGKTNSQSQQCGTSMYMAPEVIEGTKYNGKADVYSFGILMYEVVTDCVAYPLLEKGKMSLFQFNQKVVNENLRPKFDFPIKKSIQKLIERCWSKNPIERPSFEELFKKLAYNIEDTEGDVYTSSDVDKDDDDDDDENKYYLDDVDVDEVVSYADEIDEEIVTPFINDSISKETSTKDLIENAIKTLREENDEMMKKYKEDIQSIVDPIKKENEEMKSKMIQIQKENDEMKSQIVQVQKENDLLKSKYNEKIESLTHSFETGDLKSSTSDENLIKSIDAIKKENEEIKKQIIQIQNENAEMKKKHESIIQDVVEPIRKENEEMKKRFILIQKENDEMMKKYEEKIENVQENSTEKKEKSIHNEKKSKKKEKDYKMKNIKEEESSKQKSKIKHDDNSKSIFIETETSIKQISIKNFNKHKIQTQKQLIDQILSQQSNNGNFFLIKTNKLLIYLLQFKQTVNNQYIKIVSNDNSDVLEDKEYKILFLPSAIEFFIHKKSFDSSEFKSIISQFDDILFHFEYPSKYFKDAYDKITNFQWPQSQKKVKIHVNILSIPKNSSEIGKYKKINTVEMSNSINDIGKPKFFSGCTILTKITLPSSLISIPPSTFSGCKSIEQILLPESITKIEKSAFYDCHLLKQINIPSSTCEIGSDAFMNCSSITSVTIPYSMTSIETCSFNGCSSLTQVSIPPSIVSIKPSAFSRCSSLKEIVLPYSINAINQYVFSCCESLKEITIPSSVTLIDQYAFSKCTSLIKITIPDSVKEIKKCAFDRCSSLSQISIPNSINKIEGYVFNKCSSLTQITLPSSVKSIEDYAFSECTSPIKIIFPSSEVYFTQNAFGNIKSLTIAGEVQTISKFMFRYYKSLTNISIISPCTMIDYMAFAEFSSLTTISIPNTVKIINDYAFDGCSSLLSFEIPSSVKEIREYAFRGCTSLTEMTIPSTVEILHDSVFDLCISMKQLTIPIAFSKRKFGIECYETKLNIV